jgi:hypothetical protein
MAACAARGAGDQRFLGGGRDGYDGRDLRVVPAAVRAGWYAGGPRDGHTFGLFMSTPASVRHAWYLGGPRDGSALGMAAGFANPLDRDTDGDGMPDWWELPNFGWITNASPGADTDVDTVSDGSEYVADTDPHNPDSFFRIAAVLHDLGWALTFTCSPARVYGVQVSRHLKTGTWEQVEGLANLPGEADGMMSLTDTNSESRSFHRVGVGLPP